MLNPTCPECGELLALEHVGDAIWDYSPVAPPSMRAYLQRFGALAPIWQCMGCVYGSYWLPARVA